MPRRWPPRPPVGRIAARNASHPGRQPKPPPPNYCHCVTPTPPHLSKPPLRQMIPLSSTCPPTSGPPRKGPCNDPDPTHHENHHRCGVAVGGGQPLSATALTSGRTQTARRRRSLA